jgi:hypothetical protein
MASKFDELVNLIYKHTKGVISKEERDHLLYGKVSGHVAGEEGIDPMNSEDALEISPELDPEIKKSILDNSEEPEEYISDEEENSEEGERDDEDNKFISARNSRYRDGFKMMRGEDNND